MPCHPDASLGIACSYWKDIRTGGFGDLDCRSGRLVLHRARPQLEFSFAVPVVGPEDPRPALPIKSNGWPIEVATSRSDRDGLTPFVIDKVLDQNLVASRRLGQLVEVLGGFRIRSAQGVVIRGVLKLLIDQPDFAIGSGDCRWIVLLVRAVGQLPVRRNPINRCASAQRILELAIRNIAQAHSEIALRGLHLQLGVVLDLIQPDNHAVIADRRLLV